MWLEFDITYVCGMGCHNCNRMTQLVPGRSEENFRLDQSAHCRFETPGLSLAQWFLVGGEPTAHPDLEPIVRRFGQYRDRRGPGAFQVGLATHGHGSATQRRLRELQREFPFLHHEVLGRTQGIGFFEGEHVFRHDVLDLEHRALL